MEKNLFFNYIWYTEELNLNDIDIGLKFKYG